MNITAINHTLATAINRLVEQEIDVAALSLKTEAQRNQLGKPKITSGIKHDGSRYEYRHGINIDYVESKGTFYVWQAGTPARKLGQSSSIEKAKDIAREKANF